MTPTKADMERAFDKEVDINSWSKLDVARWAANWQRERDAKIAESFTKVQSDGDEIAEAIRRGGS